MDIDNKVVVASEENQITECQIKYSKSTMKVIKRQDDLLAIHTMGYDGFEAQIFALKEYEQKGDIMFKEV